MRYAKLLLLLVLINFFIGHTAFAQDGQLSGSVYIESADENAIGFEVCVLDESQNTIQTTLTDNDGTFLFDALSTSSVIVYVPDQYGYEHIYFNDATSFETATPIEIVSGSLVSGIELSIEQGAGQQDSDNDSIPDYEEVIYGADGYITNPYSSDTDGDLVSDYQEVIAGSDGCFTNPTSSDTDVDGIADSLDQLPVAAFVEIEVSQPTIVGGMLTVNARVKDLYGNIAAISGLQLTLQCDGSAVFDTSAVTGTLVSGGGTDTAILATVAGEVAIKITSSVEESVSVIPGDTNGSGLLCFSQDVRSCAGSYPVTDLPPHATDADLYGDIDMSKENVPIGFDFSFFGELHDTIDIQSNGFLSFDNIFPGLPASYTNQPLPNSADPNNIIAPFWDDLDITDGTALYYTSHTTQGSSFTVRWQNIPFFDDLDASLTFDATLFEKSNLILFSYKTLTDGTKTYAHGSSATVGVENADASQGIQYSYNQSLLSEGMSIVMQTADIQEALFLSETGDLDNDGLTNQVEIQDTLTNPASADTDSDGLPDGWEVLHNLDPNDDTGLYGSEGDFDNDGLTNAEEFSLSTYPDTIDFDNDSLSDGDEVLKYGTNPTNPDSDSDTLLDGEELVDGNDGFKTDPLIADTDNDGIYDAQDTIPVYARLVINAPSNRYIGTEAIVKYQLRSLEGDLLTAVNDVLLQVSMTGSAIFLDAPEKGSILGGSGSSSAVVQLSQGEAWLRINNFNTAYVQETIVFTASEVTTFGIRCPMQQAGYRSVPYVFTDITDDDHLAHITGSGSSVMVMPGFIFRFYGNLYASFRVSPEGYITFGTYSEDSSNDVIPDTRNPNDIIAPFWDDLSIGDGSLYVSVLGTAPSRRCVIQWDAVGFAASPQSKVTFQVVLYEQGASIEFYYAGLHDAGFSVAHGEQATVGIENEAGTNGVSLLYKQGILSSYTGYELFDGNLPSMNYLPNYTGDDDMDGLTNQLELTYQTGIWDDDSDNDGLLDGVEVHMYDSNPLLSDSDGDSYDDYQEVAAGTDLNDPLSYLHITSVSIGYAENAATVHVSWSSIPGKTYVIMMKSELTGDDFVVMNDSFVAQEYESTFVDQGDESRAIPSPDSENGARLYRIIITY